MMKLLSLTVLSGVAAAACSSTAPVSCTTDIRAGLVVAVLDSAGGQPVGAALVIAQEGMFADTAKYQLPTGYALLYERPGTYDVSVTRAGYQPWRRSNVSITRGECHVNTVALTARLQP